MSVQALGIKELWKNKQIDSCQQSLYMLPHRMYFDVNELSSNVVTIPPWYNNRLLFWYRSKKRKILGTQNRFIYMEQKKYWHFWQPQLLDTGIIK